MKINIEIQSSPNEFDIAFVSIDKNGTQGRLNKFVLKEFDLKLDNLPASDQLSNGSAHWRDSKRKKELIYIVTVGDGDTKLLLDENFSSALSQYSETWSNKRVWIPLMGTGTGGLDFRTSFTIISNAINKFIDKQNLPDEIVIALPLETDKKIIEWLVKQIALLEDNFKKDTQELNKTQELLGNLLNQKINFYVASHIWDEGDQMSRFLKESIWENHSENEYIYIYMRLIRLKRVM